MRIRYLLAILNGNDEDSREFTITDIDQGIRIKAWLSDTLSPHYQEHTESYSSGIATIYYDKDQNPVCKIDMQKLPNNQDINKIVIGIKTSILAEHNILQQEMFDLFL